MKINIGFLGDIVGRSGRNFVKENISKIKNNYNLQLLIACFRHRDTFLKDFFE